MRTANTAPVNLASMLSKFSEHWAPKKIAEINDYDVKIVKLRGDFTWHRHPDTDEFFLVIDGQLTIQLRGELAPGMLELAPVESRALEPMVLESAALAPVALESAALAPVALRSVVLGPGELFVVPAGVEHCPRADIETAVLLIEPRGVVNTGDAGGDLTANLESLPVD